MSDNPALRIAVYGAGALTYSFTAKRLFQKLGERGLAIAGGSLMAVCYALLALAPNVAFALPAIAFMGLGFYMLHNTLQTEATQLAPEARGLSVSLFAIVLFTGQAVGVALAGWVLDRWGGTPVFLAAAGGMLVIVLWFRLQLVRRNG